MRNLWASIQIVWSIWTAVKQFRDEVDARGRAALSRERAKQLRRRLQILSMDIIDGKNTGWRKVFQWDDDVGPFLAQFLDSELLESYISAPTTERRLAARQKILEEAGPGDRHGNHP